MNIKTITTGLLFILLSTSCLDKEESKHYGKKNKSDLFDDYLLNKKLQIKPIHDQFEVLYPDGTKRKLNTWYWAGIASRIIASYETLNFIYNPDNHGIGAGSDRFMLTLSDPELQKLLVLGYFPPHLYGTSSKELASYNLECIEQVYGKEIKEAFIKAQKRISSTSDKSSYKNPANDSIKGNMNLQPTQLEAYAFSLTVRTFEIVNKLLSLDSKNLSKNDSEIYAAGLEFARSAAFYFFIKMKALDLKLPLETQRTVFSCVKDASIEDLELYILKSPNDTYSEMCKDGRIVVNTIFSLYYPRSWKGAVSQWDLNTIAKEWHQHLQKVWGIGEIGAP